MEKEGKKKREMVISMIQTVMMMKHTKNDDMFIICVDQVKL